MRELAKDVALHAEVVDGDAIAVLAGALLEGVHRFAADELHEIEKVHPRDAGRQTLRAGVVAGVRLILLRHLGCPRLK